MLLPNRFMTQVMCRGAVKKCPWTLINVPNWLVAPDMLENLDNYEDLNEFGEWYDDYKKHKAKKTQIKEELITKAQHPSRYQDWRMAEDEKRKMRKCLPGKSEGV